MRNAIASLVLILTAASPAPEARVRLFVIVSPSQTVTDLSLADLRRIYAGDMTRWPDGHRIVPVMPPARSRETALFLEHVLRTTMIDYAQNWISVVFRGRAPAPPRVLATADAIRFVTTHADAIALIPDPLDPPPGVRVISVDHRAADAPGYPLTW
ncbi:MAG TPA: hypothetical protein VF980_09705 [Thermoanaerobaculia bacterium]